MSTTTRPWGRGLAAVLLLVLPAAAQTNDATVETQPSRTFASMPELLPDNALLYMYWPGAETLKETAADSELAKLMAEPQVQQMRDRLWQEVWPAIAQKFEEENPQDIEVFNAVTELVGLLWNKPASISLIDVDISPLGPTVDLAIIIKAGEQTDAFLERLHNLFKHEKLMLPEASDLDMGGYAFKQIQPIPSLPIRWGRVGEFAVITTGVKLSGQLLPDAETPALADSERFTKAMETVGADEQSSNTYLNLAGVVEVLEKFQPMFAAQQLAILGEPGGVRQLLEKINLQDIQSYSVAFRPHAKGFKTTQFLHAPALAAAMKDQPVTEPLTDDCLRWIPRQVNWASVSRTDYDQLLDLLVGMFEILSPEGHEELAADLREIESEAGINIRKDIFGALGNTLAVYDNPEVGGLWFAGMTLVTDLKPHNRFSESMASLVMGLARWGGEEDAVTIVSREYREGRINFVNFVGLPVPVAPAWGTYQNKLVIGLFPQMVRCAMDQLIDPGTSLLDNADFRAGRDQLAGKGTSISYVDNRAGVASYYAFALPISAALFQLAQEEDIPLDAGLLPALPVLSGHFFGDVAIQTATEEGFVGHSYGPTGFPMPAVSSMDFTTTAMMSSILLPSLGRSRELSMRTVSAANMKAIGTALFTYANENDDKLPPDLQTLVKLNLIAPPALIAPNDHRADIQSSYLYIEGQNIQMPQQNIVAYEHPFVNDFEGVNVMFLDSHVEYLPMDAFKRRLRETLDRLDRSYEEEEAKWYEDGQPKVIYGNKDVKIDVARVMVSQGSSLNTQLKLYSMHVGHYPEKLDYLIEQPEDHEENWKWRGPYIASQQHLQDPWGNKLHYKYPGDINKDGYDLWSAGPDGESGTDDDIGNW